MELDYLQTSETLYSAFKWNAAKIAFQVNK